MRVTVASSSNSRDRHLTASDPRASLRVLSSFFVFFNDTATTEIYTLSLHDALPISSGGSNGTVMADCRKREFRAEPRIARYRSEEHTSELQSRGHLVCRLLLAE